MAKLQTESNLGLDAVIAQLAKSEKEVIESSYKLKQNHVDPYESGAYAFCYDTGAEFDNAEHLLAFLVKRAEYLDGNMIRTEAVPKQKDGSKYLDMKIKREIMTTFCPVTGQIDMSSIEVTIKNAQQVVEFSDLNYIIHLMRYIAILHEDLAYFLKMMFQVFYKTKEVFVHLESVPAKTDTRFKFIV